MAIALVLGAVALGGIAGAKTREASGELAAAVRYTYNLAAINNKVYALYIDIGNGTYHAAPLKQTGECDRVLLALDGKDSDAVAVKYGKNDEEEDDDDEEAGKFDAAMSGSGGGDDGGPPSWTADSGGAPNKLVNMLSGDVRDAANNRSQQVGVQVDETDDEDVVAQRQRKKIKSFRTNLLGKPRSFPKEAKITGVLVRDGDEPITEGVVPIVFYPHGFTQRAFIYIQGGDEDAPDEFTVEILSLQGTGVVHSGHLDERDFKKESH